MDSGETTCYKQVLCKTCREVVATPQTTSITICNTTIKTYTNNSKLTLAIINCTINNMQTSIFVYLLQGKFSQQGDVSQDWMGHDAIARAPAMGERSLNHSFTPPFWPMRKYTLFAVKNNMKYCKFFILFWSMSCRVTALC